MKAVAARGATITDNIAAIQNPRQLLFPKNPTDHTPPDAQ
jgi:hypothetical protein